MAADIEGMANDVCAKCHGRDGTTDLSIFPRLAGQPAAYLEKELQLFRGRGRSDPHARAYMWGIAGPLTDYQIKGLADYFAAKPAAPGKPSGDTALVARGKEIFEKGIPDRDVPVCTTCHGAHAEGQGEFPRLAGQNGDYLYRQLVMFRSQLRESDIMEPNVKNLGEDDALAVAAYLSSQ